MIDVHSHLLPGLDDGAKSWDITLEMCRLAIEDGITHIVATPHADDTYTYDRDRVRDTIALLNEKIEGRLSFSIGCDFHLSFENIEDAIAHPERYTIAGRQYLLAELSDYGVPPYLKEGLMRLQMAGMTPVITHPERNAILQRNPKPILEWVESGCLVQITASSITGFWGAVAKQAAWWLLHHDAVHVIATDAHDDKHRPPLLSAAREALAKRFGPDMARVLVLDNPAAMVAGRAVLTPRGSSPTGAQAMHNQTVD